jgi:hypothetical protein
MGGRRVGAVMGLAAACFLCVSCLTPPAHAGDDEDESHYLLFSGRDLWRNGAFLYGGLIAAPGGFDQSGFLLKLLLSGGLYRYNASNLGGEQVVGAELAGQVAPGFFIKRGSFEAKVFFGPEWQQHRLWPDDPDNQLRGRTLGLRFSTDVWYEPSAMSMVAGDASLSSIGTNFTARIAYGWRVGALLETFDFYTGPETQLYGDNRYRQWRFGLHVTSMKTGDTEWTAAGGWSIDSDHRGSPYVRLSVLQRQ